MLRKAKLPLALALILVFTSLGVYTLYAQSPLAVEDDPLVRLPGTQPNQVSLEGPNRCMNCHGDYDQAVEPAFNWRGSMMANAGRDPLFWATLAIAEQDAPSSGDLCIRCHSPGGWMEGRADDTGGSHINAKDREGVQCDFCHRQVDPMYAEGISRTGDLLDMAIETGVIDKRGSYFYLGDDLLAQGRENVKRYLTDHGGRL